MRALLTYIAMACSLTACDYQAAAPVDEVEVRDIKGTR